MKNSKRGIKMVRSGINAKLDGVSEYKNYCRELSSNKNAPEIEDSAVQQNKRRNSTAINSSKARSKKTKSKNLSNSFTYIC